MSVSIPRMIVMIAALLLTSMTACTADDGGSTGRRDSGPGGEGEGEGEPPDAGPACGGSVPAPTAPACSAAARSCLMTCMDAACDACFESETQDCFACLDQADGACGTSMGCQAQWGAYDCCYAGCADPSSMACDTMCGPMAMAFYDCLYMHPACEMAENVCFP